MLITVTVLCGVVVAQGVLFFFLHKRVESLAETLETRTSATSEWCEVLNDNQTVLSKDMQRLFNEVKTKK